MSNPYTDIKTDNYIIREFNENVDPIELLWHRDLEDRTVTILEGDGWYFQRENELPLKLINEQVLFIPKNSWHRVIKGNSELIVEIEEL